MSINHDSDSDGDKETDHLLGVGGTRSSVQQPNYYDRSLYPSYQEDVVEVEILSSEKPAQTQNSVVTIFSMWNTMMGTSLLSMPWAIKQAGFVNGIVLLVAMAGVMAYTCYRVLTFGRDLAGQAINEFTDVVKFHLGRVAEIITLMCSLLTLLGGTIVYWILMSNFLYHIVVFIYDKAHGNNHGRNRSSSHLTSSFTNMDVSLYEQDSYRVVCPNISDSSQVDPVFSEAWNETNTVPFILILIVFPLLNFKSPTFFTKFNSFGTLSVIYLFVFVAVKAGEWGPNLHLNSATHDEHYSPAFKWTFPALTGIAALAYFLQNCVMAIVRTQKHPENNTRDLIIAYALVCLTYVYMGAVFYFTYPHDKSCIEDNFLNNLSADDTLAFVARTGLFFQMLCVLPLLAYVFRTQLLYFVFHSVWPNWWYVLILNFILVCVCVVFAVFMPQIGHIIGFVGAFCGFSYAIALPCAVYLVAAYRNHTLTIPKIILHGLLVLIGFVNFISQFVIIGHTT